jgi:hypothetical protein
MVRPAVPDSAFTSHVPVEKAGGFCDPSPAGAIKNAIREPHGHMPASEKVCAQKRHPDPRPIDPPNL